MRAILLLAGLSRRFWPLDDKAFFPVCGKTVLEHKVAQLQEAGITDIVLVGGKHNLDKAKSFYPDLTLVEQENLELGMQGALLSALPHCGTDPVLVLGSNDIVEPSAIKTVIDAAKTSTGGALLAQKVRRYFPGGYLTITDGPTSPPGLRRVQGIMEKPGEGNEPSDLVNIVVHAHNDPKALLAALKNIESTRDDGYEAALQTLLAVTPYVAVPYEGFWQPIKYPWHLLPLLERALKDIAAPSIHSTAQIHPTAVMEGNVVIGEGTKVLAHATIVGPCVIGKRAVIATGALVRASSIGDDCVVGFASEVKGSLLDRHVWTHMTYIGDSIIGENVAFGAGSITGNYRLDEGEIRSRVGDDDIPTGLQKFGAVVGPHVRVGIRTAINPGVKIGGGTFVSSGALLQSDIPDSSYVTMKDGNAHVRMNTAQVARPEEKEKFLEKAIGK